MAEITVRLNVNGVAHEGRCEPRKLLVDFIREDLGLTGTHVGCEHGICGACTIMFNGEAARTGFAERATSSPVSTAATPGSASAAEASIRAMRAWACGERRKAACRSRAGRWSST